MNHDKSIGKERHENRKYSYSSLNVQIMSASAKAPAMSATLGSLLPAAPTYCAGEELAAGGGLTGVDLAGVGCTGVDTGGG
jgi:hypothetical protein